MILFTGLTGGIASGKSSILRRFAELGAITRDADAIVHQLYEPGNAGHEAIVRTYGTEVLHPDGTIDRRKLADAAFANAGGAQKLNALIHPLVIAEQLRMAREVETSGDDRILVIEATLLIESGGLERYDRIVVVDVAPETQIERGVARGMPREEVLRRIAHQMPREERLRHAHYVIDNNGDEGHADEETRRVYERLRADLAEKKRRAEKQPAS